MPEKTIYSISELKAVKELIGKIEKDQEWHHYPTWVLEHNDQ